MRILVRLPNWLGDAVMATPALENLLHHFPAAQVVLVGQPLIAELFAADPRFVVVADHSRTRRNRWLGLWQLGRELRACYGPFALAWSFPNRFSARFLLRAAAAPQRIGRRFGWADVLLTDAIRCQQGWHQAEIYNALINGFLGTSYPTGPTRLPAVTPYPYPGPTAGLHPGAAYGGAKRWDPDKFAETAIAWSRAYHLVLFGGAKEAALVDGIAARLCAAGVTEFTNLAGRTTIRELVARIAGLDLFVCNDSGPMHVAGAFGVPTVAVFGPTDPQATHPWAHPRLRVVRHAVPCAPCQARRCPLQHHACMRELAAPEVIAAGWSLAAAGPVAAAS